MAKLRKGCSYRELQRPFTRKSKYKKKAFIKAVPNSRVVRYNMGNPKKQFTTKLELVSRTDLHLRHNCLESARLSSNRLLEKTLGKTAFYLVINVYPHHILRENPLASGAGADRMSTGMKRAFGKSVGVAARVRRGQPVFTVSVDKENFKTAHLALQRATHKLPNSYSIRAVSG